MFRNIVRRAYYKGHCSINFPLCKSIDTSYGCIVRRIGSTAAPTDPFGQSWSTDQTGPQQTTSTDPFTEDRVSETFPGETRDITSDRWVEIILLYDLLDHCTPRVYSPYFQRSRRIIASFWSPFFPIFSSRVDPRGARKPCTSGPKIQQKLEAYISGGIQ
jgi:hypothetical protein